MSSAQPPQQTPNPERREDEDDQANRELEEGLRSANRRAKRHGKYVAATLLGGFAGFGKEIGSALADKLLK